MEKQWSKANRPFPSSLVPLFQGESKCETILRKMTLICMKMKLHAELIFIWKVLHLDSFWNRGTRELGNGLFSCVWTTCVDLHITWQRSRRFTYLKCFLLTSCEMWKANWSTWAFQYLLLWNSENHRHLFDSDRSVMYWPITIKFRIWVQTSKLGLIAIGFLLPN